MTVDAGTERASGPVDQVVLPPAPPRQDDTVVTEQPAVSANGKPSPDGKAKRPPELASGRRRGRRVRRIIRRIDLWSVLKLALVLYTCMYAAVLATLAILWGLAYSSGSIERLQTFLGDVGLENYHFYGGQMFRASAAIGAIVVIAATVATVLATALINVISEVTGGIRVVVIEEDLQPR